MSRGTWGLGGTVVHSRVVRCVGRLSAVHPSDVQVGSILAMIDLSRQLLGWTIESRPTMRTTRGALQHPNP